VEIDRVVVLGRFGGIWIWNVVDKLPIRGITSTNGDGGLVQTTLEAVDGSRLGSFFVQVVSLGDCSGKKEFLYAVIDSKMHLVSI